MIDGVLLAVTAAAAAGLAVAARPWTEGLLASAVQRNADALVQDATEARLLAEGMEPDRAWRHGREQVAEKVSWSAKRDAPGLPLLGPALSAVLAGGLTIAGPIWGAPLAVLVGVLGAIGGICDGFTRRLPNPVTGALTAVVVCAGVLYTVFGVPVWPDMVLGCLGWGGLLALLWLLTLGRGIGLGDVKVAAPLGAVAGLFGAAAVAGGLVAACVLAAVAHAVRTALGHTTWSTAQPFGPYLVAGVLVGAMVGPWLDLGLGLPTGIWVC